MATKDVPPKKPTKYLWPAEAVNIAQKKQHPVRLCEELSRETRGRVQANVRSDYR